MKVTKNKIEGLLIIEPDIFNDDRGYFFESFNDQKYAEIGITNKFVQDNQSISHKNVIRGLHYQIPPYAQDKLVRVVNGKALDVAVDIREGSPTYGEYFSIELSGENNLQIWIPKGFAHGFASLEDNTILQYKCTNFYSPEHERGIVYNDKVLDIKWDIDSPVISNKDLELNNFENIKKFKYNKGILYDTNFLKFVR